MNAENDIDRYQGQLIELIDPQKREFLESVCREIGLPKATQSVVLVRLFCLTDFERHKGYIKTARERSADLELVERLAIELEEALNELDGGDGFRLSLQTQELKKTWCEEEHRGFPSLPRGLNLIALGEAARLLRQARPTGKSGGRPPLLKAYASEVKCLWDAVADTGMKPGRGGDFERLCDAVFEAAGVPAKAEGAIRYFTKNLLHKKKNKVILLLNKPRLPGTVPDETTPENDWNNPAPKPRR